MPVPRLLLSDDLLVTSDLPAQALARHLALQLPPAAGTTLIGAMRQLLEHGVHPTDLDLAGRTPWQAIDLLGRAAGLPDDARAAAAAAAREDVARSLFLLDPADRLRTLLDRLQPDEVVVVVTDNPSDAAALVAAVELSDQVHGYAAAGTAADPSAVALAASWPGLLALTAAAGGRTGLIDRFGTGPGSPTWRAAGPDELFSMLEAAL